MNLIDETHYEPTYERIESFMPTIIVVLIVSYLLFVIQMGPKFMKNRPAYKLKTFMCLYNIFQVVACVYIINRVWSLASWSILDVKNCVHYDKNTPQREAFDDVSFKILLLKVVELTDTIIFVLRKKQNQISYLHVFHHSSTITLCYLICRYAKVSGGLFPILCNSFVHIIMYSYYFFANICSVETMKKFIYIKKSITVIQMIQFCMILAQATIMWTSCKVPTIIKYYYYLVVAVIFYGFYDFYKKTYLGKQAKANQ